MRAGAGGVVAQALIHSLPNRGRSEGLDAVACSHSRRAPLLSARCYVLCMLLDQALARLNAALVDAGVPPWRAPVSIGGIEALEFEIAPLRLPAELREFWTRVDPRTLRVKPYPTITTPEFALDAWEAARDMEHLPLALVLVGCQSHECVAVELDVAGGDGGALFEYFISAGDGFTRRYERLADWLEDIAQQLERGNYFHHEDRHGRWATVSDTGSGHPGLPHVGPRVADWPEHWQRAQEWLDRESPRRWVRPRAQGSTASFPPRDEPTERKARDRRTDLEERWIDGALTPDELDELERDRGFDAAVVELIRRAERSPAFAAGVRRFADRGSVWLGFTRAPDLRRRRVLGDFPWPDRVHAYRAARSARELDALQNVIWARREDLGRLGVRLTACSVD